MADDDHVVFGGEVDDDQFQCRTVAGPVARELLAQLFEERQRPALAFGGDGAAMQAAAGRDRRRDLIAADIAIAEPIGQPSSQVPGAAVRFAREGNDRHPCPSLSSLSAS